MNKFIHWLETSFAPRMTKINNNQWIVTLKDSIMQTLPLIFLGSLFCCLTIPGDVFKISWWPDFWTPFGWTLGMISLMISFLIPFNLMEKKRFRQQRLIGGMTGIIVFAIIITPQLTIDKAIGFSHGVFGAGGMFIAILAGIFVAFVMGLFGKFSFFKEDSVIPDFVRSWFDSMLPIGICVVIMWILVDGLKIDIYNAVLAVVSPLSGSMETLWGFIVVIFLDCFLYSMGISGWVLTPITKPIFLAAITANAAGTAANLVTSETIYSAYLAVGGMGCTFPLVIMMMLSRSSKLKALGKACIVPAVFNINEPVVFGAVAWNPVMMFPMWLQAIVLPIIVWIGTKVIAFAPVPKVVFDLWYTPFPISTWITTQSVTGIILMLVCVAVSTCIWYPFFKMYEKNEIDAEALKAAGTKA